MRIRRYILIILIQLTFFNNIAKSIENKILYKNINGVFFFFHMKNSPHDSHEHSSVNENTYLCRGTIRGGNEGTQNSPDNPVGDRIGDNIKYKRHD